MNKYELTVVISAKLEDEERAAVLEKKVLGRISRYGGNVTDVDDAGKKKLAYEIQKMSEGYYYFITFETDNTDCPHQLESKLRITENVIRFMCVAVEE